MFIAESYVQQHWKRVSAGIAGCYNNMIDFLKLFIVRQVDLLSTSVTVAMVAKTHHVTPPICETGLAQSCYTIMWLHKPIGKQSITSWL